MRCELVSGTWAPRGGEAWAGFRAPAPGKTAALSNRAGVGWGQKVRVKAPSLPP